MISMGVFIQILCSFRYGFKRFVTGKAFFTSGRLGRIFISMAHRARDTTILVSFCKKFALFLNEGYAGTQHNRYY
jgi:hypothetical protein